VTTHRAILVAMVLSVPVCVWFALALRKQAHAADAADAADVDPPGGRLRIISNQRGAGYYCQDYVVRDDVRGVTCYTARCDKGVAISCLPDAPAAAVSR